VNDPDIVPPTSTQDGAEIKPLGEEVMAHPTSPATKFVPETATSVLARPEVGDRVIVGVSWNGADLELPLGFEVTVTIEVPGTEAPTTVNEPVTTPPVIEHVDDAMMFGADVIAQVVSPVPKPVPLTDTIVPVGPSFGVRVNADADFVKLADTGPSELGKSTE